MQWSMEFTQQLGVSAVFEGLREVTVYSDVIIKVVIVGYRWASHNGVLSVKAHFTND